MKADLSVVGPRFSRPARVAAAATRFFAGEPMHSLATYTSGAASVNTVVVAAADTPVIGTHTFLGVSNKSALVSAANAVVAHKTSISVPVPQCTIIRGKGETAANIDTDAELLAILQDVVLIDYNATGSPTSGPLYTIKDTSSADTSGLTIVDGNIALGTLDVVVDARALRSDVV